MHNKLVFFAIFTMIVEILLRKAIWERCHATKYLDKLVMISIYLAIFVFIMEKY